jgi:hypothetical protein
MKTTAKAKKADAKVLPIIIIFDHVGRDDQGGIYINLSMNGQDVYIDLDADDVAQITDMWNAVLSENAELAADTSADDNEQPNAEAIPPELHS